MRRRTLLVCLIAGILVVVLGAGLYRSWIASPRYALQRMALDLKTRNMDQLFKYVNIKAIANNLAESALPNSDDDKGGPEAPWDRKTQEMGRHLARLVLSNLSGALEKQIRQMMEKYLLNLDNRQILAIATAATTAQIEVQGDDARVTLVDPKTKEPFHFQMQRQPKSGTWQIVAVNYQDLKKFAKREF
ncbi:MAG: hypothetical protein ABSC45_09995 [Desulfobaccales bacterium]|jgi:hypothetical protein